MSLNVLVSPTGSIFFTEQINICFYLPVVLSFDLAIREARAGQPTRQTRGLERDYFQKIIFDQACPSFEIGA